MATMKRLVRPLLALVMSVGLLTVAVVPAAMALPGSEPMLPSDLEEVADQLDEGFEDYSPQQLKNIGLAADTVRSMRQEIEQVQPDIQLRNWSDVHDEVAVLLPELRQGMYNVTEQLKLSDRALARAVSTEILIHLERVDEADEMQNYQAAEINYMQALQDFDIFLTLIPTV